MASDDDELRIERACRRCNGIYLISLAEADQISPDAMMNLCPACIEAVFRRDEPAVHIDEFFRQLKEEDEEPDWFGSQSDWKGE
jgi:hypothetical protein